MKKWTVVILSLYLAGALLACSPSDEQIVGIEESVEEAHDASQNESTIEVSESDLLEEADSIGGLDTAESKDETEEEFHVEQSDYTPLMVFFTQLNQDITFEEIEAYSSENGLYCNRKYYTGDTYEVRVASEPEVAKIGRYRERGENVFFTYNADDTLSYAEYSDDAGLNILFFGYGRGIREPRDMSALGWGGEMVTGMWYYHGDEGPIETDTPGKAIDGAFKN